MGPEEKPFEETKFEKRGTLQDVLEAQSKFYKDMIKNFKEDYQRNNPKKKEDEFEYNLNIK